MTHKDIDWLEDQVEKSMHHEFKKDTRYLIRGHGGHLDFFVGDVMQEVDGKEVAFR